MRHSKNLRPENGEVFTFSFASAKLGRNFCLNPASTFKQYKRKSGMSLIPSGDTEPFLGDFSSAAVFWGTFFWKKVPANIWVSLRISLFDYTVFKLLTYTILFLNRTVMHPTLSCDCKIQHANTTTPRGSDMNLFIASRSIGSETIIPFPITCDNNMIKSHTDCQHVLSRLFPFCNHSNFKK